MEISITAQLWAILYSVIVGAFLGLAYDVVRMSRVLCGLRKGAISSSLEGKCLPLIGEYRRPQRKLSRLFGDVFVFVGDIVFFVFATAVFCVFVFHANYGNGRWFLVAGCALGFLVYFFTLGRLVMAFSDVIRFVLVSVFLYLRYFLTFPAVLFVRYAVRPLRKRLTQISAERRTDRCEKHLEHELGFDPTG